MSARCRLMVDTNVLVDFLAMRQPFYAEARLLMLLGRLGEFELMATASQITDLIYILSEGGKAGLMPEVTEQLRAVRTFVEVAPVDASEVDRMLFSGWEDPEDCLIHECALSHRCDAIITRDAVGFERSLLPVFNCEDLFAWAEERFGMQYAEVGI